MMLLNNADILYELFTVELKYDAKICCEEVSEKTMHLLNWKKSVCLFTSIILQDASKPFSGSVKMRSI